MDLNIIKNGIEYIVAAHKDNPSIKGIEILHNINDSVIDTQGFIGVDENKKLIIAFKGTNSFKDIITDVKFWKKRIPYDNPNSKIRVHTGFINAYKSSDVRDRIHSFMKAILPKEVLIVGHSLGGALAHLCAVDIQYNTSDVDITCVSAGSPRVGNWAFARSYNKRVPKTYRIVNGNDPVPGLPPFLFFYKHVKNKVQLAKRYWWKFWGDCKAHSVYKYREETNKL